MRVIIRGGRRFNSVQGKFEDNKSLIVEGETIVSVDSVPETVSDGDCEVDATGKTIMPGFINLHGHLGWDGYSDLANQTESDGAMKYIKVARGLQSAVEAGFTSFRDLGCVHDAGLIGRQAVRDGLLPGPTVYACGRPVCRTGGHIWQGCIEADGVAAIREAIRKQARDGVDLVKLMAHGYSEEEVEAAVETAKLEGLVVTTDAGTNARAAVVAGVDSIEHGGDYDDALIEMIAEKGLWIIPTLSPMVQQYRHGAEWGMQESVIQRRGEIIEKGARQKVLARARAKGVRIAFGTDSGSPVVPHGTVLPELEALLEFGILDNEVEALQSLTIWAAECMGMLEKTGSLEAGKHADITLVDGDLENDLSSILNIDRVYVKGYPVVRGGQALLPDPRDFQEFVNVGA